MQRTVLIFKALTDANFRKTLESQPAKALGVPTLTPAKVKEVQVILAAVKEIDSRIGRIADELLCADGGLCGIARIS